VSELSDNEALEGAIQGDPEAFSILYERYIKRIYNYVYYRTGSAYDAEDITERVFHRAFGHIQTYNNRGVPTTWSPTGTEITAGGRKSRWTTGRSSMFTGLTLKSSW